MRNDLKSQTERFFFERSIMITSATSKTPHFFERADTRNTSMCLKKLASNPIRIICQNSKRISLLFFIFVLCQMRLHLFLSCHFMQNKKKPFIC